MKFKAVLFDLDGTLLDTLDDLADSMNAVLKDLGFPGHEVGAYRYYVGDGMEVLCQRVLPDDHRDPAMIEKCLAGMREEYGKRWNIKTKPYDGIPQVLEALAAQSIKTAVLSNKPDDLTRVTIDRLLPKWKFDIVLGERPGVPRKPDPAAALEIAQRLDIKPEQIVYLGDTGIDMKTATAAGMYPVGALWGFRTREELLENGAAMVIAEPTGLLKLF
ncbi:MAG TPA: HAD family hydrolase [bacterium]